MYLFADSTAYAHNRSEHMHNQSMILLKPGSCLLRPPFNLNGGGAGTKSQSTYMRPYAKDI